MGRRSNSVPGFPPPPTPTQELQRAGRVEGALPAGGGGAGLPAGTHLRPVPRREGRRGGSAGSSAGAESVSLGISAGAGRARMSLRGGRGGPSGVTRRARPAARPPTDPLPLPPRSRSRPGVAWGRGRSSAPTLRAWLRGPRRHRPREEARKWRRAPVRGRRVGEVSAAQ